MENNSRFYLTTPKGLFFYTLWENSNFLGNSPSQWYLFSRDMAVVFSSEREAIEHKETLLNRIKKQGTDYIETHLKKHPSLIDLIPEHENKIKKVINKFSKLEVSEKIIHIN